MKFKFKVHGEQSHPLRGIGYRIKEGGPLIPLIDGRTGEVVSFPKAEVSASVLGVRNEAFYVLTAMDKFDGIAIVACS